MKNSIRPQFTAVGSQGFAYQQALNENARRRRVAKLMFWTIVVVGLYIVVLWLAGCSTPLPLDPGGPPVVQATPDLLPAPPEPSADLKPVETPDLRPAPSDLADPCLVPCVLPAGAETPCKPGLVCYTDVCTDAGADGPPRCL